MKESVPTESMIRICRRIIQRTLPKKKPNWPFCAISIKQYTEKAFYKFLPSVFKKLFGDPLNIFLYDVLVSMIGISIILFQTHPKLMINVAITNVFLEYSQIKRNNHYLIVFDICSIYFVYQSFRYIVYLIYSRKMIIVKDT